MEDLFCDPLVSMPSSLHSINLIPGTVSASMIEVILLQNMGFYSPISQHNFKYVRNCQQLTHASLGNYAFLIMAVLTRTKLVHLHLSASSTFVLF